MTHLLPSRTSLLGALAVALVGGVTVLPPAPVAAAPFGPLPERLADVNIHGQGVVLGGRLYFPAQDSTHGVELWSSDGTAGGTRMVTDLWEGATSSNPASLVVLGGRIYFRANDGITGSELWSSDGTEAGTRLVQDIVPGGDSSAPIELTVAGNRVYFTAVHPGFGRELWASTGTTTYVLGDLRPGFQDGEIRGLTAFGSRLLFGGEQLPGVRKPYITDGNIVNRLDDWAVNADLAVGDMAALGDRVIMAAGDANSGQEVWVSDGQPGKAVGLRDIQVGTQSSFPAFLTRFGDQVYFTATRSGVGSELWTSDGTPGGTQQVRDIRGGADGSNPQGLTDVAGRFLAFTATDGVHGSELWASDGTPGGTRMVRDIAPGEDSGAAASDASFTPVAGQLFFAGRDGNGREPWLSDGTAAGTRPIADLVPGSGGSIPRPFGVLGNTVLFATVSGRLSLWSYTVTPSRTRAQPKASYSLKKAKQRRIVIPVRVEAPGTRPTGAVTLTMAGRVVGRSELVNGIARVRIKVRLRKGKHRLVATYAGSPVAQTSATSPFVVRVR